MSEIRIVSYTLTGEGAPVVYHECRSVEATRAAYMPPTSMSRDEVIAAQLESLRQFVTAPAKPSKRLGIVYSPADMVELWAANYIQCGPCKRAWDAWYASHPLGEDLDAWLSLVEQALRENELV